MNTTRTPLAGKVVIVTGAGRGIGRSIALAIAARGGIVALAARSKDQLEAVCAEIRSAGGTAAVFPTDMHAEDAIRQLVTDVVAHFGRLDAVVNNAGIGLFGPLAETTTETWEEVMTVNARGTFILCREALPYLRQQPVSHIVNITSVVGVKGYVNQSAYSASKHAVMGMTKALAREVQADGVRVHAVCPGGVDTNMVGDSRPDLDRSELISPEEVADAAVFLLSQCGSAVVDEIHIRRRSSTPWG